MLTCEQLHRLAETVPPSDLTGPQRANLYAHVLNCQGCEKYLAALPEERCLEPIEAKGGQR